MNNEVTPTMTLAKLYESQDQYLDAFLVYQKINQDNPEPEISDKLKELQDKIFANVKSEYNKVINKIFTAEECKKFRIIPHDDYLEMTRVEEEPDDIPDIADSPDKPAIELFKNDLGNDIDMSDLTVDQMPETEGKPIHREIEMESVDVHHHIENDFVLDSESIIKPETDLPESEKNLVDDLEKEEHIEEDKIDNQTTSFDDEMSLSEIMRDIQSIDLAEFTEFLKDNEGKEPNLADFKLSELQKALKKFKNGS